MTELQEAAVVLRGLLNEFRINRMDDHGDFVHRAEVSTDRFTRAMNALAVVEREATP